MKAFTRKKYGGPEVLHLTEENIPSLKPGHLLIRIKANSVNPADWHIIRGEPFIARFSFGLFKPKDKIPGVDFAGVVEQVGEGVKSFTQGDAVFGESLAGGAFAQYICVPENICAKIPDKISFLEMASLPVAGLTALQSVITHGNVQKNEKILINGSSGGVGHLTVQVAKICGAHVTAVCSSRNVDFVKDLGADQVIAYDKINIHEHPDKYDLVIDTHGNLTFADFKRMGNRGVLVGFTTLGNMMQVTLAKTFRNFPLKIFTATCNTKDLQQLSEWVESKKLKVSIEKKYPYNELPSAISYIEAMHTRGKVVVFWDE